MMPAGNAVDDGVGPVCLDHPELDRFDRAVLIGVIISVVVLWPPVILLTWWALDALAG